jgi:hypothetical protein
MEWNGSPFLGIALVVRHASSQSQVVFQHPAGSDSKENFFGIGWIELGKFALPAHWLMNRKLDFEIEQCGPILSSHGQQLLNKNWNHLRFVSFPCDCDESPPGAASATPSVSAFNIVFVFDSRYISDDTAELFWQALATLSRALIVEEGRCRYLSDQVSLLMGGGSESNLSSTLVSIFEALRSDSRQISLYVNGSILTHLSVIPFNEAPEPPSSHESLLLLTKADTLQQQLPVDSASNVRRLIDAADPSKTMKDHMIELGLPISTIQRISQHLVYWNKARIVPPLNKRLVLSLSPALLSIQPSADILAEFRTRFGLTKPEAYFFILYAFSRGKRLSDIKESLTDEFPSLSSRFNDLCSLLLSNRILDYNHQFFRYFPPTKRLGPNIPHQRPKFQNLLPHEIRSEYSPTEFEVIFERLKYNSVASELMIKFISKYVKRHKDLMSARIELNELHRCSNEDFHRYTEPLTSGYLDSLLVRYDCDL